MSEDLINDLLTALITVLILLLPVTSAIIVRLAKNYLAGLDARLQLELKADQYFLLQEMTELFISSAEQMYLANPEKLAFVDRQLLAFAKENNIPLTQAQSNILIEGLVKGVKQGLSAGHEFSTGEMTVSDGS